MRFDSSMVYLLTLVYFYLLLGCASAILLFRIIYYRHPIKSFQTGFLSISLIWCSIRAVMLVWSFTLTIDIVTVLYQIPITLQFMSFSLLVLYYAFLLYQRQWKSIRTRFMIGYWLTNSSVAIVTIVMTLFRLLKNHHNSVSDEETHFLNRLGSIWFAIQFTILVVAYGFFGIKLHHYHTSSQTIRRQGVSHVVTTATAWIIFATHWLYNILASIAPKSFGVTIGFNSIDRLLDISVPVFALLFVWEILPTFLVIYMARKIPATEKTIVSPDSPLFKLPCCRSAASSANTQSNSDSVTSFLIQDPNQLSNQFNGDANAPYSINEPEDEFGMNENRAMHSLMSEDLYMNGSFGEPYDVGSFQTRPTVNVGESNQATAARGIEQRVPIGPDTTAQKPSRSQQPFTPSWQNTTSQNQQLLKLQSQLSSTMEQHMDDTSEYF